MRWNAVQVVAKKRRQAGDWDRCQIKDEYRTERLPGEVSCGRWLCFFILDTYAAFVGKRKKYLQNS